MIFFHTFLLSLSLHSLFAFCDHSNQRFIRLHRAALESDHVSAHLHLWIDLIFGHAQGGPAAVAAQNVFYHLTYQDAIDIEAIEDPLQRQSTIDQVNNFGQVCLFSSVELLYFNLNVGFYIHSFFRLRFNCSPVLIRRVASLPPVVPR